jgi:hypothetical protein
VLNPPSGTGAYKLGVNYAPGIVAQKSAIARGYAQNLWLHGPEHYLTEVCLLVCRLNALFEYFAGWNNEHVCCFQDKGRW